MFFFHDMIDRGSALLSTLLLESIFDTCCFIASAGNVSHRSINVLIVVHDFYMMINYTNK